MYWPLTWQQPLNFLFVPIFCRHTAHFNQGFFFHQLDGVFVCAVVDWQDGDRNIMKCSDETMWPCEEMRTETGRSLCFLLSRTVWETLGSEIVFSIVGEKMMGWQKPLFPLSANLLVIRAVKSRPEAFVFKWHTLSKQQTRHSACNQCIIRRPRKGTKLKCFWAKMFLRKSIIFC